MKEQTTRTAKLKEHPSSHIIPDMRAEEHKALRDDITQRGILHPIEILKDGTILDGRNRWLIAVSLGLNTVPTQTVTLNGTSAEEYMIRAVLLRRHLSDDQRAALARKWQERQNVPTGAAAHKKTTLDTLTKVEPRDTRAEAAALFSVPERKIRYMAEVETKAPELVPQIERGEVTLLEAKKHIRHGSNALRIAALSDNNSPLPDTPQKYNVIYADPPWRHDFPISGTRKVENHYPTMALEEIIALPVSGLCAEEAILFLWVPAPFSKKGHSVLEAWGFDYRTQMVWVKPSIGTGQWVRQRHELLYIGVRGNLPTPAPEDKPDSVLEAPRLGHSEKPEEMYARIEKMYPGLLRIELFARARREGWDAWGNQA